MAKYNKNKQKKAKKTSLLARIFIIFMAVLMVAGITFSVAYPIYLDAQEKTHQH